MAGTVETALAAPISTGDTEGCRLLLEAGVDPRRYADEPPCPAVYAAIRSACSAELVELLLAHGADPDAPGPDGRSPYRLALGQGRTDLAALLRRAGAGEDATDVDRLLSACLGADHAEALRLVADHPGLLDRLTDSEKGGAMVRAAEVGSTAAVELMLDLGFPIDARAADSALDLSAAWAPPLAELRASLGLAPTDASAMVYRHLHICFTPPSFDGPDARFPFTAMFFLHLDAAPPVEAMPAWLGSLSRCPTVLVSLGTVFYRMPGVYEAIFEAVRGVRINLLVAAPTRIPRASAPSQPTSTSNATCRSPRSFGPSTSSSRTAVSTASRSHSRRGRRWS
jgi:hypothetical protein